MRSTIINCDICNAELIESHNLNIAFDSEVFKYLDLCDEHKKKLMDELDAIWPGILERSK